MHLFPCRSVTDFLSSDTIEGLKDIHQKVSRISLVLFHEIYNKSILLQLIFYMFLHFSSLTESSTGRHLLHNLTIIDIKAFQKHLFVYSL